MTRGLVSSGSSWEVISSFGRGFLQVFAMAVVFTPFSALPGDRKVERSECYEGTPYYSADDRDRTRDRGK